jgi:hypothetical protein
MVRALCIVIIFLMATDTFKTGIRVRFIMVAIYTTNLSVPSFQGEEIMKEFRCPSW